MLVGAVSLTAASGADKSIAYQVSTDTYLVSPATLNEIRSIGLVQAESSVEVGSDDSVNVMNAFVIDVGSASANAATGKSARILRERGWEIIGKKRPWFVMMKSTKWDAFAAIESFEAVHLTSYPDIKSLKNKSVKTEASVIITVEVYRGE
ncbi:hypothetical protein [Nonomuraea diastatica]|uniref:Uncharacterized protein n=1 Tax=Nonomuraea diastatica TaxID=1848329 RepID=A0A4R4WB87_9ACTN|nr:hypothetical protein [Nonomuraea diastatica]TDD16052.1 hypothetical protein E1294_32590 [Nonomuraea diastatica]